MKGFTNSKTSQGQLQTNSVCAAPSVHSLLIHLLHLCDKCQADTKINYDSFSRLGFTQLETNLLVANICNSFRIII